MIGAHPFVELVPPMNDREYARLKADIERNGQLVPVVLHEGLLLDGRNRKKLGKVAPRSLISDASAMNQARLKGSYGKGITRCVAHYVDYHFYKGRHALRDAAA